jgi:hypothetical protein
MASFADATSDATGGTRGSYMPRISINIIRVGSDQFTTADESEISSAIAFTRATYATVGLTLDRVLHFAIPTASARGREIINDDSEASTLTDEWTVNNNAIDVFFVRLYAGTTAGLSPVAGPCDKNAKGMDGTVVEIRPGKTGVILAHEVCHYLGLHHVDNDSSNLMFPSVPNGGQLTAGQGWIIGCHCFIEDKGICVG